MPDVNELIRSLAQEFTKELASLRTRLGRSPYESDTLELSVKLDSKVTFELRHQQGYQSAVRASTLGALLDEVYRRAGFDDRESGRLQATSDSLLGLPAPEPESEPEPSPAAELDDQIPF